jgi:hypothetical protein
MRVLTTVNIRLLQPPTRPTKQSSAESSAAAEKWTERRREVLYPKTLGKCLPSAILRIIRRPERLRGAYDTHTPLAVS